MQDTVQELILKSQSWLKESVFPLWTQKGIDPQNGGFVESLNADSQPSLSSRRALVQARQIFAYTEAAKLNILKVTDITPIIKKSTDFLIQSYSLPNGAFLHAADAQGKPENLQSELYTQAFVLFGLARAYELLQDQFYKETALKLMTYLTRERTNTAGGFTEIKNGEILYQSNPHMHLFEAVLAWAHVDSDPVWLTQTSRIYDLCRNKFVDATSGVLAEHFTSDWQPLQDHHRFYFEPGHQYEWAWLLLQFQKLTKTSVGALPKQLFCLAEQHGVTGSLGLAVDEVWSDFSIKKKSSRFWPQTERVKAALEIGLHTSDSTLRRKAAQASDQALKALWIFLDNAPRGQWQDTRLESGEFTKQDAKASSLYHIINAMSEYIQKRPLLK